MFTWDSVKGPLIAFEDCFLHPVQGMFRSLNITRPNGEKILEYYYASGLFSGITGSEAFEKVKENEFTFFSDLSSQINFDSLNMPSDPHKLKIFRVRSLNHPLAQDHYEPYGKQILESFSTRSGSPVFTYRFEPDPGKHKVQAERQAVTWNNSVHNFLEENQEIKFKSGKITKLKAQVLGLRPETQSDTINAILKVVNKHLDFDDLEAEAIKNSDYSEKKYLSTNEILKKGSGICHDYSNVFVALSRSLGLPARMVYGIVLSSDRSLQPHIWAEVLMNHKQWIPVEPQSTTIGGACLNAYLPLGYRESGQQETPGPVSYLNAEQSLVLF